MLPGLAPHHTRGGFIGGNRLRVEKYAPSTEHYSRTAEGLWLLPSTVTDLELGQGQDKLVKLANLAIDEGGDFMLGLAEHALDAHDVLVASRVSPVGCMTEALAMAPTAAEQAVRLAEYEMRTFSLDDPLDLPHLKVCDNGDCYNPRHFDFRFGRSNLQERRVELNPDWYQELPSGKIKTIWGNTLPSVAKSLERYIQLQRKCFPHVPIDRSVLTPGAMSQVRFQPTTGCWEAWSYYCRPDKNGASWQFDGYGRLYQRLTNQEVDYETGEITKVQRRGHWLAHRVVWAATPRKYLEKGKVLNHLCSYRRCCNPYHLEQVDPSVNVRHGVTVQAALKESGAKTASAENYLSAAELVPYNAAANEMYRAICASKGLAA